MQQIPADRLPPLFFVPAAHLLVLLSPFKRMRIELIVFRLRSSNVFHESLPTVPRASLQVVITKGAVQHFSLIEPRSMNRSKSRAPPSLAFMEELLRRRGRVTWITILNQVDAPEP